MLKTLVNGCSSSTGPGSWPYLLQSIDQNNLINLACAAAGNDYIFNSTVNELCSRSYSLVLINWTVPHRVDLMVEDIDYFKTSTYTSKYQSTRNDWLGKKIEPVDDQSYVQKNWLFGSGHYLEDSTVKQSNAFYGIYRYTGSKEFLFNLAVKIISLENILKNKKIPYVFSFTKPYYNDLKCHLNLYEAINWDKCLTEKTIYEIAEESNDYVNGRHPGLSAHQEWAKLMDKHIKRIQCA